MQRTLSAGGQAGGEIPAAPLPEAQAGAESRVHICSQALGSWGCSGFRNRTGSESLKCLLAHPHPTSHAPRQELGTSGTTYGVPSLTESQPKTQPENTFHSQPAPTLALSRCGPSTWGRRGHPRKMAQDASVSERRHLACSEVACASAMARAYVQVGGCEGECTVQGLPCSGGACPGGACPGSALSRGHTVQGLYCPGGAFQRLHCPGVHYPGGAFQGVHCPGAACSRACAVPGVHSRGCTSRGCTVQGLRAQIY